MDEVKSIRDKAEAMAAYARQAKDTDLVQWATEIKVRAERKCGEMLRSSEKAKGGKPMQERYRSCDTTSNGATLADMGISKDQSSRWQKLADMPEEHFETAVATAKEHAGQVTTAHMLRMADEIRKNAAMREELDEAERTGKARDARDPDVQALSVWVPIESALENTLKAIARAEARATVPTCPGDKAQKLIEQWATISEFLSQHARQS